MVVVGMDLNQIFLNQCNSGDGWMRMETEWMDTVRMEGMLEKNGTEPED